MNPTDNSPESSQKADPSATPPIPESNGQNGAGKKEPGIWPFDGPQPYKLSPEELEWLREQWAKEDPAVAAAGLKECLEGRGVTSEELFRTLEKVVRDNG